MQLRSLVPIVGFTLSSLSALGDPCYVTTASEFQTALNHVVNQTDCGTCSESQFNYCPKIIIPSTATIIVGSGGFSQFSIGNEHDFLELTIDGTIEWAGGDECGNCKMLRLRDATDITITGTGKFMTPSTVTFPNPDNNEKGLPIAINIVGTSSNIEIDGLEFENVGSMIKQEDGTSDHIYLRNLTGTKFWDYGMWLSDANVVEIENCHVGTTQGAIGTYRFHGFRLYGNDLKMDDCSARNTGAYGLWRADGDVGTIDGFDTNEAIRLGPNHACENGGGEDLGQRTKRLIARNITTTMGVEVQNGTIGCLLEEIDSASITIGNGAGSNTVPRPVNSIYWRNVNTTPSAVSTACIGDDIREAECLADVTSDGVDGVPDLLAVINAWGAYTPWNDQPLGGTCSSLPNCSTPVNVQPIDIGPIFGDGSVGVPDLLAVINGWGCGTSGGVRAFPTSLSDCWNEYCDGLTGTAWQKCIDECTAAVCQENPAECE